MAYKIPNSKFAWSDLRTVFEKRDYQDLRKIPKEDLEEFRNNLLTITNFWKNLLRQIFFFFPFILVVILHKSLNISEGLYIALVIAFTFFGAILNGFFFRYKTLKLVTFGIEKGILKKDKV